MTTTIQAVSRPHREVWRHLVDPSEYPRWLVGANRVVTVDDAWPRPGSAFTHRIGAWPLALPGSTTVEASEEPRRLVLRAGMGLLGEMRVTFDVVPTDHRETLVRMVEEPSGGAARVAGCVLGPLLRLGLFGRNALSLARFRALVGD